MAEERDRRRRKGTEDVKKAGRPIGCGRPKLDRKVEKTWFEARVGE
jgi:hypothetical protein